MLRTRKARATATALAMISPALAVYGVFILGPSLETVNYSLTKWDGVNPVREFVGLANYGQALGDPQLFNAFLNNLIWLAAIITIPLAIAILLAVSITARGIRGRDQYLAVYFLPHIISPVVIALIWRWVYNPTVGILSNLLAALRITSGPYGVLGDARLALASLILIDIWAAFGFSTVVYVNALQIIDANLYDAAEIDGAGSFRRFIHVTLPGISSVTTFLVLLNMINSFKVFNQVFLMTQGGPVNATEVVGYVMYIEAFKLNHVGYGSAIAVLLSLLILIVGVFYLSSREKAFVAE
jgi:raffinose/stachyose/melibiose transport system permease protein